MEGKRNDEWQCFLGVLASRTARRRFCGAENFDAAKVCSLLSRKAVQRRPKAGESLRELSQTARKLVPLGYSTALLQVLDTLAKDRFVDA